MSLRSILHKNYYYMSNSFQGRKSLSKWDTWNYEGVREEMRKGVMAGRASRVSWKCLEKGAAN